MVELPPNRNPSYTLTLSEREPNYNHDLTVPSVAYEPHVLSILNFVKIG